MILTLIGFGFLLLGITRFVIYNKTYIDVDILGLLFTAIGSISSILFILIIISAHVMAPKQIQLNKMNYEGLCKRYETIKSDYEDVSKSQVIADITAWNMDVYNTKYWTENPWTNWFNPREIADNIDYIPLEGDDSE